MTSTALQQLAKLVDKLFLLLNQSSRNVETDTNLLKYVPVLVDY